MTNSVSLIDKREQRFQSLALLTIITLYLLILAGGIVRSTGSGMGCPDWPKCFGRWIPPTELSQLPPNYQAIYGAKLKGEIEFNALKTWIEYINRLLGVLTGFFILATVIASISYWRKDKAIVWGSVIAFVLVGANGWLGSRVVATELAQYMITLHLLLAILVAFSLLFVLVRSRVKYFQTGFTPARNVQLRWLLLLTAGLTSVQILLGTQVRDALDTVIKTLNYTQRENWISQLNWTFYIHRSFSLVILVIHLYLFYQLRKTVIDSWLAWLPTALLALLVIEIGTGVIMAYLGVPAIAQPIHLVFAIGIISLQFVAFLAFTPTLLEKKDVHGASRLVTL